MSDKDGYFLAKRQMVEAIDSRTLLLTAQKAALAQIEENVDKHREISIRIIELETIRAYIRNVMLWEN